MTAMRTHTRHAPLARARAVGLALAAWLAVASPVSAAPAARPRLIVLLVVDQMRADYLERYGEYFSGGLRRLASKGAVFSQAAYPYLQTVTCTGHATIATGVLPSAHGMILNSWWDRGARREIPCTFDAAASKVGAETGKAPKSGGGDSARLLAVPTLADELRAQQSEAPRIVSVSLKTRSAIMMAGHGADAALWFDKGRWITSSAFSAEVPAFATAFAAAHPIDFAHQPAWQRLRPLADYAFTDDGVGENPPRGWSPRFPHAFADDGNAAELWTHSPAADEHVVDLAIAAVGALGMGGRPATTDFLGLSFSTLDLVGHAFGPRSHEIQDILFRLDRTLERLFVALDRAVGVGRYAVALTADHGVAPLPEQMTALGFDAGRVPLDDLKERLQGALARLFGAGKFVDAIDYTDIYFAPGIFDRLRARPQDLASVSDLVRGTPGVAAVFTTDQLRSPGAGCDTLCRAAVASHFPGRSGDLILAPKPYWITTGKGTTHGSANAYDQRVPVIVLGPGVKPGVYPRPASPLDVAPTLAELAGITLARPDGRVLVEALTRNRAP